MRTSYTTPRVAGTTVTFEWHGSGPVRMISDLNEWDQNQAIELKKNSQGIWQYHTRLPEDAYVEYAFLVDGKRSNDPHNPNRVHNGINAYNNYFYMPGGGPTPLAERARGISRGRVARYLVPAVYLLGEEDHSVSLFQRAVYLYQPAVKEPCPLLVVFDGPDYLRRASLAAVLDNLIAQKRIRPLAVAMLANGRRNRFIEYACSDVTLGFLLDSVLPVAHKQLHLLDIERNPGAYGVLGASMGGLMALYTGLRSPQIFGKVLSQSGSYFPQFVIQDLVRNKMGAGLQVWLDVGTLEYLYEYNQRMYALMAEQGYAVQWHEFHAGHNYIAWRDNLAAGLEYLFA
jgi:enterochelin esterase family protein